MEIPAVRERDYRAEIKQGLVAIDLQGRQLRLTRYASKLKVLEETEDVIGIERGLEAFVFCADFG